jgi:hypothetical protein
VKWANTEREVHLWAAGETGATEAVWCAAPGDVGPEPGAGARDARTREAPGEEAALLFASGVHRALYLVSR